MRRGVLLLTGRYPHSTDSEARFVGAEVPVLRELCGEVIVFPLKGGTPRVSLPAGTVVDGRLAAARLNSRARLGAATAALQLPEAREELRRCWTASRAPAGLVRLLRCCADAVLTERALSEFAAQRGGDLTGVAAYSYWLGACTLGSLWLQRRLAPLRVVSRAHGSDLYEDRHRPPYIPFQPLIARTADRLYPVSDHGATHLRARLGAPADKVVVARLGVEAPTPHPGCAPSTDGVWRLVSCAVVVPVKRMALVARSVGCLARMAPGRRVEWVHLGGGPDEPVLREAVDDTSGPNLKVSLRGHVSNAEVLRHYQEKPVDLFVNLSASEGIPVSVMEAAAAGVPILGMRVGGMPEIVTEDNGILLDPGAGPEEVAAALLSLLNDTHRLRSMREGSRRVWRRGFQARPNFERFASDVRRLQEGTL
jgi:glycosyltransferase involved in cell wall biosynthesis